MDAHAVWSGGGEPSLAESNAEIADLFKIALELPILPVAGLIDPDAEAQIG